MKFLADENLEREFIRWLRDAGHDVLSAAESSSGAEDAELLPLALDQARVVITGDLDFGELVFLHGHQSAGVILIRIESAPVPLRTARLIEVWPEVEPICAGHFVVVSRSGIRIRPLVP
ncbi:MAG TPA: DUF5615 family PIN-like protein [Tepidisphaeraceae bacterium]|jgi:predicted nuclease of predicted toxin-antitoxin system